MSVITKSPSEWIVASSIGFIDVLLNIIILKKELDKRRNTEIHWVSNYLKYLSLICLISGVCFGFFFMTQDWPILCYFGWHLGIISIVIQQTSLGYYQLVRLYYCFSETSIHSTFGYSNILFIIMYTIGAIQIIISLITVSFRQIDSCKINNQYQFISKNSFAINTSFLLLLFGAIPTIIYLVWEWTTLYLYIRKLLQFVKSYQSKSINLEKSIYDRIKLILIKITILAIVYEIFAIFLIVVVLIITFTTTWYGLIIQILTLGSTVIVDYSMYLMQEHNSFEYQQFLRKIYYIGCCKKCLKHGLSELNESSNKLNNRSNGNVDKSYTTNDISSQHGRIEVDDVSVERTVTIIDER